MKGLAELAHGGGCNAEEWITGVAKRLNTGESTVVTPVLTQRERATLSGIVWVGTGGEYSRFEDPETGRHISFEMNGPYCSIKTRTPSAEDLDSCRHIVLTSEAEWNPSEVEFSNTVATISAIKSMSKYEHALTRISPLMWGPTFAQAVEDQVSISDGASRPRR